MGREVEETANLPFLFGTLVHLRGFREVDFVSLSIYDYLASLMTLPKFHHDFLVRTDLVHAKRKHDATIKTPDLTTFWEQSKITSGNNQKIKTC